MLRKIGGFKFRGSSNKGFRQSYRAPWKVIPALGLLIMTLVMGGLPALADSLTINFETYAVGTVNGQDGWSSTGAAGSGCAVYDHAIVSNSGAPASFGTKSLRMSNAVTSGCFSDQTFSKSLANEAGETSAQNGGMSGGTRQNYFEAQWDFASTVPGAEQPGLSVVASPDRGDGARMSWVQMRDTSAGLEINFNDYQRSNDPTCSNTIGGFVQTTIATGLDRTLPHKIKITMAFADGSANDLVRVYVDGALMHTGTSWEDYYRDCEPNSTTRTVDSLLFRTGGTAAPATAGKGFLIDNITLLSGAAPQCTTVCYVNGTTGNDADSGATPTTAKKTIQAALNVVSTGGTVNVAAGTYPEQLTISRSVNLLGAGTGATIVDGVTGTNAGISLAGGTSGVTVKKLTITRFDVGIALPTGPLSSLLFEDLETISNSRHGIFSQAFSITDLVVRRVNSSNNNQNCTPAGFSGRGIWIINGTKTNITIEDGTFNNNCLVGIDISDGNVTGTKITGNTVIGNGDAGIGVLGAQGPGSNLVANNTVTNNGRFGIEIKVPNGNGASSGPGSVVVSGNVVMRTVAATDARDYAGIAVIRRSGNSSVNADQPTGVVVTANEVSGFTRKPSGSTGDGFGIVVEGLNQTVTNNKVTGNNVGIQVQGGNVANTQSTDFFDRGDAAQGSAAVNLNSISGNNIGLRVVGNASADGTNNWWGSPTGPSNAANPGGTGDSVVGNATFAPWLCDGTDTLPLIVGFQPNASNKCGIATRLVFSTQPGGAAQNQPLNPQPVVTAVDNAGNRAYNFSGSVTVTIGTNPSSGTLAGTTMVNALNGVATFTNLSINNAGNGYTLVASASGLGSVTSNPFNIGDMTPPTTTATTVPPLPASGWYTGTVKVTLTATDNPGGSGVKQITYSATGAQTIAPTTVMSSTVSFNITAEGVTTIKYSAQDIAGNNEPQKTLVIKIDKTAPTFEIYFDRPSKHLKIKTVDSGSGAATADITIVSTNSDIMNPPPYVLTDSAGNTIKIYLRRIISNNNDTFAGVEFSKIETTSGGTTTTLNLENPYNENAFKVDYSFVNGNYLYINQSFNVQNTSQQPGFTSSANWKASTNKTGVTYKRHNQAQVTRTDNGFTTLRGIFKNGKLDFIV